MHHLLVSTQKQPLEFIVRDFKSFTAKEITRCMAENVQESRDWMIYFFERSGRMNPQNKNVQLWQQGYHPVHCWNGDLIRQRINYIHQNPVRAGFVSEAHEWKYSSASDYVLGHGLVKVEILDIM